MISRWRRLKPESSKKRLSGALQNDTPSPPEPVDAKKEIDHSPRLVDLSHGPLSSLDIPFHGGRLSEPESEPRGRPPNRRHDPLGLTILHEPKGRAVADIVFVHGLGGSSRQTWCKNRDPDLFWPCKWLPQEHGLCDARVMSFGYNAHFASFSSKDSILNITDFAKDLLFSLKFATFQGKRGLVVGSVPIIFVAHSMGGLVVKKAYILGQNDIHYMDIVTSTKSMVFLSTPHRGANLADTLNRVLGACIFGLSPKQYVAELKRNSPALEDINEQFRNLASNIDIISFYETLPTSIVASSKTMILQKDSAILGYPDEISKPLDADHHGVCKYVNKEDPNYVSVRDILQFIVAKTALPAWVPADISTSGEFQRLAALFGNLGDPTIDLDHYTEKRMNDTCSWILEETLVRTFLTDNIQQPWVLWCTGKPGAGKSVLTSFLVDHFQALGLRCAFFFFHFGNDSQKNTKTLLMSLAYQIAHFEPLYRQYLLRISDEGLKFAQSTTHLIWQKLFVSSLLRMTLRNPIYIIIDGLDECETSPQLLKLLADITNSNAAVRILMASRKTQQLSGAFERLSKCVTVHSLSLDSQQTDLRLYVTENMRYMRGESAYRETITMRILEKAMGSFLWVHLMVNEVLQCHTQDAVEQALDEIPEDLEMLYERMDATLARQTRAADQAIARAILMWVACSTRSLTLSQLGEVLKQDYPRILDLKSTISQVCGEFVVVDRQDHVSIVHSTARDVLIRNTDLHFHVRLLESHFIVFTRCLNTLSSPRLRANVEDLESHSFQLYAAISWPHHLEASHGVSDQSSLSLLASFLGSVSVLDWIYSLSAASQLRAVIQASEVMNSFLTRVQRLDAAWSTSDNTMKERKCVAQWATDLVRIVEKFGTSLSEQPKLIFNIIPPFCPITSIIHHQFAAKHPTASLVVSGLSSNLWEDDIARFLVVGGGAPFKIASARGSIAVLTEEGTVISYHAATREEEWRLKSGERALTWCFDSRGENLATYGLTKTRVWNISTAKQLHTIDNPPIVKALGIAFTDDDSAILSCSNDRVVRKCSLSMAEEGWSAIDKVSGQDVYAGRDTPRQAVFSPDRSQIAVACRGSPVSVWPIGKQRTQPDRINSSLSDKKGLGLWDYISNPSASCLVWNSTTGHLLGINDGGRVFKWHPADHDLQTSTVSAAMIKCSTNGKFFVTSNKHGSLLVWDFYQFSPISQLTCASPVSDLTFNSEGSQIFDLRGSFCYIWEPNAVIHLGEEDDTVTETQSPPGASAQTSVLPEALTMIRNPITALAVRHGDSTHATGNADGLVRLYNSTGEKLSESSPYFMAVEHICWSASGTHLAFTDLSRGILVKTVDFTNRSITASSVLTATADHQIQQILLCPNAQFLLVSTERLVTIWSVAKKAIVAKHSLTSMVRWLNHPLDERVLLGISFLEVSLFMWEAFDVFIQLPIDRTAIAWTSGPNPLDSRRRRPSRAYSINSNDTECLADVVLVSVNGNTVLVETSSTTVRGQRHKQFMLMNVAALPKLSEQGASITQAQTIYSKPLPPDLISQMEIPLGFVAATDTIQAARRKSSVQSALGGPSAGLPQMAGSDNILAFLSRDFWVCSYVLSETRPGRVKRHHFLPRDWLDMDMLELAVVRPDGTLLCPRNGEVAVVTNALKEEWLN